jgi:8-oxo-dGTP pyrophosphatase MutT (NUDIX family)
MQDAHLWGIVRLKKLVESKQDRLQAHERFPLLKTSLYAIIVLNEFIENRSVIRMQESIHQAATIILMRERVDQERCLLEVYMTKRPDTMRFLPSHYVFPGGQMDDSDADPNLLARCAPLPANLNSENISLAYWVTAIRETFEEVGILLVRDEHGQWVTPQAVQKQREALLAGELSFGELIEQSHFQLAVDRLRYFGHRLTPRKVSRKRFDTRYFLTLLPNDVEPQPHAGEVAEAEWLSPQAALVRWEAGQISMVPPTVDSLRVSARFATAAAIWNATEGVGKPTAEELA